MKKFLCTILILAIAACGLFALAGCNSKVITVGYTVYPPMNYEDAEGNLIGFDTDLAKAVFEKMGYTVNFKEISWENKYIDLNSGNIDCIWNGFTSNSTDTDEAGNEIARSKNVDFSYNYMVNKQAVIIRKADAATLTTVASFADKTGYAEAGSAGLSYAEGTFEDSTVNTATKQTDAIMQVRSKAADFAVVDLLLAENLVGKGDYADLQIVSALTSEPEYYGIGFKLDSKLTEKVNKTLEELAADGTMMTIAKKYGLEYAVITDFANQK